MAHPLVRILERNPVIPALKSIQQVEQCASAGCEAAFLLCGDILNIADVIDMLHKAGKKAVVHADLVNGLAPREIAADTCTAAALTASSPPAPCWCAAVTSWGCWRYCASLPSTPRRSTT